MGVELYWDNDDRSVMLMEFEGQWTWDELFQTLATAKKASDQARSEIGAIVNISGGVHFPGGSLLTPQGLENAKKMIAMSGGSTGPIVIAGANPMLRTIYDTMSRLNPGTTTRVDFAPSLESARALLAKRLPAKPQPQM